MGSDWKCAHCGDVIGVYEPLILVDGSGERLTSRAAEPELAHIEGRNYHRTCRLAALGNGQDDAAPRAN
jgi:hypothetical protein